LKILCIVQARLRSRRLPNKAVAEVNGRSMIAHVWERAQRIIGVDEVVLNVPLADAQQFRRSVPEARVIGMPLQEEDVLGSYRKIAREERAEVIVRLTGDCPLADPNIGTDVLRLYLSLNDDLVYCANDTLRSGFPDGLDIECFSMKALNLASDNAHHPDDREHVTLWMRKRLPCYTIVAPVDLNIADRKWSVDTHDDLLKVRGIYRHLHEGQYRWQDTLKAEQQTEAQ
jgi:spore coat polysaccharide biosynthesis protein SpsF (cytidylyltransferase family)